jgi:hypothetical protein
VIDWSTGGDEIECGLARGILGKDETIDVEKQTPGLFCPIKIYLAVFHTQHPLMSPTFTRCAAPHLIVPLIKRGPESGRTYYGLAIADDSSWIGGKRCTTRPGNALLVLIP